MAALRLSDVLMIESWPYCKYVVHVRARIHHTMAATSDTAAEMVSGICNDTALRQERDVRPRRAPIIKIIWAQTRPRKAAGWAESLTTNRRCDMNII